MGKLILGNSKLPGKNSEMSEKANFFFFCFFLLKETLQVLLENSTISKQFQGIASKNDDLGFRYLTDKKFFLALIGS